MQDSPTNLVRRAPVAFACAALWVVLVIALHQLSRANPDLAPPACQLKRVSGVPCPTCGGTRSTFALIQGKVFEAIAWNPWIVAMHVLILISLCAWIFRQPNFNLIAQLLARPKLTVVLLLVSLGLNWIYVLKTQL